MTAPFRWQTAGLLGLFLFAAAGVVKERRAGSALRRELDSTRLRADGAARTLDLQVAGYKRLEGHVRLSAEAALEGQSSDGRWFALQPDLHIGRLLLYSIVPNCPSCWEPIPLLNAVATAQRCDVEVVGVVVGDSAAFERVNDGRVRFRTVFHARGGAWDALPLSQPGSAVLLGDRGRLERLWPGTPDGLPEAEVRSALAGGCELHR